MSIDLVIKQGTILDGTASKAYEADLAIYNGRIVEIGEIQGDDVPSLNAKGMYVTPGFIDIHSHSDWTLIVDPREIGRASCRERV